MYSIIIPSVGRIKFLNELLESIYKQSLSPREILILLEEKDKYSFKEEKLNLKNNCKIIYCKNLNLAEKRNYGALIAKTEYIIFSDDDDIWEIDKGKFTVEALNEVPVVCHEFSKFGFIQQSPKFYLGKKDKIIKFNSLIFGRNIFGGGSGIAARKEIVMAIKFNQNFPFCEDFQWWIKVLLADIEIKYISKSLVRYRVHKKNMTGNFFKIYFYNIKIFNNLISKSLILLLAIIFGYLRTIFALLIKFIMYILFFNF